MPLRFLQHPLGAHVLTHLRDKTTKPALFRTLSYQISLLLALEATRDIATEEIAMRRSPVHRPVVLVAAVGLVLLKDRYTPLGLGLCLWALARLGEQQVAPLLEKQLNMETDAEARGDIQASLSEAFVH